MYNSGITRGRELSSLAKGQGFYRHGVEVECFSEDIKAFSLAGHPFLRQTESGSGKFSKPYRNHKLNLPKTYVTKRGQMVLFTAPDDMILGCSCVLHKKEMTNQDAEENLMSEKSKSIAAKLLKMNKNDRNISSSSKFEDEGVGGENWAESREEAWQDEHVVKAGHFPDVYVRDLKRVVASVSEDCIVEDLESKDEGNLDPSRDKDEAGDVHTDLETVLIPECDSGLGYSITPSPSGRLSSLSHHSDSGTLISIPHASTTDDGELLTPEQMVVAEEEQTTPTDEEKLAALKKELSLYKPSKVTPSSTTSKKSAKAGKKRRHPKLNQGGDHSSSGNSVSTKSKNKKSNTANLDENAGTGNEVGSSKAKSKKRRGGKQVLREEKLDSEMTPVENEETLGENLRLGLAEELSVSSSSSMQVTAVQLAGDERVVPPKKQLERRASRAEERKLEIERKRAEKRELERLKRREEEERQRLMEELEQSRMMQESLENEDVEEDDTDSTASLPLQQTVVPNHQRLLDSLQEAKRRENQMLLAFQEEQAAQKLAAEMDSAQDAIERAKAAAEGLKRRLAEEERKKREEEENKKRKEEEMRRANEKKERAEKAALAKRAEIVEEKISQLKNETQMTIEAEKKMKRYQNSITQSIMFSYFKYAPPPRPKPPKKTKRGTRRPQVVLSK